MCGGAYFYSIARLWHCMVPVHDVHTLVQVT